jgi:hypothetical protein
MVLETQKERGREREGGSDVASTQCTKPERLITNKQPRKYTIIEDRQVKEFHRELPPYLHMLSQARNIRLSTNGHELSRPACVGMGFWGLEAIKNAKVHFLRHEMSISSS